MSTLAVLFALVGAPARVVPVHDVVALQAAIESAQPGDDIVIAAGRYDVNLTFKASGTAARPIILRADGKVTLSAKNDTIRVLELDHVSHWRLLGFGVRGSRHADIRITGGTDNLLSRLEVYDAKKKGIIANGDHITIDHCFIHDIAQPVGGDDTQGVAAWDASHLTIQDSRITTPGDGILIGGALELSRPSTDVRILRNHFHADDAWYGRLHTENGVDIKFVDGLIVRGNVFHHYHGRDEDDPMGCAMNVVVRDPQANARIEHVRIEKNVFYDVNRAIALDAAEGPGRDFVFSGNFVIDALARNGVKRKPPGGIWVGNWDGAVFTDNFFIHVDKASVFVYRPVPGLVFERNFTLGSPGLVVALER